MAENKARSGRGTQEAVPCPGVGPPSGLGHRADERIRKRGQTRREDAVRGPGSGWREICNLPSSSRRDEAAEEDPRRRHVATVEACTECRYNYENMCVSYMAMYAFFAASSMICRRTTASHLAEDVLA